MKKSIFYTFLLAICACHKPLTVDCQAKTSDISISTQLLVGKWELMGIIPCTPDYCPGNNLPKNGKGTGRQMRFDDNGQVSLLKNDTLIKRGNWRVIPEYVGSSINLIEIPNDFLDFKMCTDTLVVSKFAGHSFEIWAKQ
jgi:hypothetical protein